MDKPAVIFQVNADAFSNALEELTKYSAALSDSDHERALRAGLFLIENGKAHKQESKGGEIKILPSVEMLDLVARIKTGSFKLKSIH